jgi:predicted TIM-barrel enzyme
MPFGDANAIVMDMAAEVLPGGTAHARTGRRMREQIPFRLMDVFLDDCETRGLCRCAEYFPTCRPD